MVSIAVKKTEIARIDKSGAAAFTDSWFLNKRLKIGFAKIDRPRAQGIEIIAAKREEILEIIKALPKSDELEKMMLSIGHPTKFSEIGLSDDDVKTAEMFARDIRDKYVLGRLLWDLGLTE